jgi:SpoVK/Ycf46/Vps4 family AAA+-type ATPase
LICGISGTGKSLTAKAVATAWGVPLLRIDLGALRSKYVGESEGNLRRALRVIEAIGRCVVWLDEIEKALAGATQGAADGGVSSDALGALLVWMQERVGEAFVIATTNDAAALPPEITRKGRFDELWWVDLPNAVERREIALTALRAHARDKAVNIASGIRVAISEPVNSVVAPAMLSRSTSRRRTRRRTGSEDYPALISKTTVSTTTI